jgi:hypothetical protein
MKKVIVMVLTAAVASLVACTSGKTDSSDSAGVVDSGAVAE